MNRFILALIIIAAWVTLGCSKKDPNPELRDPIYKDLKSQTELHQKEVDDQKKMLSEFKLEIRRKE